MRCALKSFFGWISGVCSTNLFIAVESGTASPSRSWNRPAGYKIWHRELNTWTSITTFSLSVNHETDAVYRRELFEVDLRFWKQNLTGIDWEKAGVIKSCIHLFPKERALRFLTSANSNAIPPFDFASSSVFLGDFSGFFLIKNDLGILKWFSVNLVTVSNTLISLLVWINVERVNNSTCILTALRKFFLPDSVCRWRHIII